MKRFPRRTPLLPPAPFNCCRLPVAAVAAAERQGNPLPKENRMRFATSSLDTCKRYLDSGLHYAPDRPHAACGGHFGQYLKDLFGIERLPYSITIVEMLERRMIKSDLLIRFPKNANGKRFSDFYNKGIYFSSSSHNNKGWGYKSFLHPYDVLGSKAWRRKIAPSVFKPEKYSNRVRIPYEAYFRYWRIYIFAEALSDGYDQISGFLAPNEGIGRLEERFQKINDHWEKTYKDAFDRLSYYQAAKAILHTHKTLKRPVSEQEWAKYLSALEFIQQEKLSYTPDMMEEDIETLLDLFRTWERRSKKDPKYYMQGLVLLRRDIYDLTEWLSRATKTTLSECFERRNGWRHYSGDNHLKRVVCFERFALERVFENYTVELSTVELCNKKAEKILKTDREQVKDLFDRLSDHSSFGSWVRILSDLQGQLGGTSTKNPISFKETRVVDYLRNFANTTEALIRQMAVDIEHQTNRLSSLKVFKGLQNKYGKCKNPTYRGVLGTVIGELKKDKKTNITDLFDIDDLTKNDKSIFSKVNCKYKVVPGSGDVQNQFALHSLLSFVTARNYAAHHFCRDDELNNLLDDQSCQIFCSCIASIVFIDTIVQEIKKAPIVRYTAINP